MINFTLFDDYVGQYSERERIRLLGWIFDLEKAGFLVKWNDHQAWSWATIQFEDDAEAVEFKLRYL